MTETVSPVEESDALSAIAKQRRAQLEVAQPSQAPSAIEAVERSEVLYTLELKTMPFSQANLQLLNQRMSELYNLTLDPPDLSPLLKTMSPQQLSGLSSEEVLKLLVRSSDAILSWSSGRYPSRNDFVEITRIRCNFESIYVSVRGESQVAENIAKEVLEAWWEAAGVQRTFDRLASGLLATAYATTTRLNLGRPVESLVDPAIFEYLDANLTGGDELAASMGRSPASRDQGHMVAKGFFDDLTLRISLFDTATGQSSTHNLTFSVVRQSDYGTGFINLSSSLPYEKHETLVAGLFGGRK